MSAVRNE